MCNSTRLRERLRRWECQAKEILKKYHKLGEVGIENLKKKYRRRRGGKKSFDLLNLKLEKLDGI